MFFQIFPFSFFIFPVLIWVFLFLFWVFPKYSLCLLLIWFLPASFLSQLVFEVLISPFIFWLNLIFSVCSVTSLSFLWLLFHYLLLFYADFPACLNSVRSFFLWSHLLQCTLILFWLSWCSFAPSHPYCNHLAPSCSAPSHPLFLSLFLLCLHSSYVCFCLVWSASIFSCLILIYSLPLYRLHVLWQHRGDTKAAGHSHSEHASCLRVLNDRQPRWSLVCQRRGAADLLGLNVGTVSHWQHTRTHSRQFITWRCTQVQMEREALSIWSPVPTHSSEEASWTCLYTHKGL